MKHLSHVNKIFPRYVTIKFDMKFDIDKVCKLFPDFFKVRGQSSTRAKKILTKDHKDQSPIFK